jgi:MFS family permease
MNNNNRHYAESQKEYNHDRSTSIDDGISESRFDKRFWLLVSATFLGFLGIGTVLPGLAPHVRRDLGGSDRVVGLVIGTFSFVALGSRLFCGPLADRRGKKLTFLIGLMSCSVAGAVYVLPIGILGAYGGRILQGFGEACLYTAAAAWAVELAGVQRSGQALGYISSGIWGGISAGPMIGHWAGTFAHAALFQLSAASAAFCLALLVHEDSYLQQRSKRNRVKPLSLLVPGLAIGFVNVHYPVITGFLILYLAQHGGSGPVAFSTYAMFILLSRFFLGKLPDRIHPAITFYAGLAGMAVGLIVIAAGPPPVFAIGAAALLGLGFSFPWSSVASTVLRRTPNDTHGSVVAILSAFYDLFVGVSSLVAGQVADRHGYSVTFVMAAVALLGAAIAGWFVFSERSQQSRLQQDYLEPAREIA